MICDIFFLFNTSIKHKINMQYEKQILLIVQVLLIAGAINWGLVAYNGTDVVTLAAGKDIGVYIKYAVALAGIYSAYSIATK